MRRIVASDEGEGLPVQLELNGGATGDDRWLDQVAQLVEDLRRDVGAVRKERSLQAGSKGGVEVLILALGSSGAFAAMVDIFRAWLSRDRDRSVTMTWEEGGVTQRVTVQGESVDSATLKALAAAAARRRST